MAGIKKERRDMSDKIYPKGIIIFPPHANAPDFVKGSVVITPGDFVRFCEDNQGLLTEYKNKPQLRCQLLEGDKGLYLQVDTYRTQQPQGEQDEPIPF